MLDIICVVLLMSESDPSVSFSVSIRVDGAGGIWPGTELGMPKRAAVSPAINWLKAEDSLDVLYLA